MKNRLTMLALAAALAPASLMAQGEFTDVQTSLTTGAGTVAVAVVAVIGSGITIFISLWGVSRIKRGLAAGS